MREICAEILPLQQWGMQMDWTRLGLQRLRCGLQHPLSLQLVNQKSLAENIYLKLEFECKILLQRTSAVPTNCSSLRAEQDSSYASFLETACRQKDFVSDLPSHEVLFCRTALCVELAHRSLVHLCDHFLKGSSCFPLPNPLSCELFVAGTVVDDCHLSDMVESQSVTEVPEIQILCFQGKSVKYSALCQIIK